MSVTYMYLIKFIHDAYMFHMLITYDRIYVCTYSPCMRHICTYIFPYMKCFIFIYVIYVDLYEIYV